MEFTLRLVCHFLLVLPVYLVYAFFWVLPVDMASAIGARLGRLIGRCVPETRRALKNLKIIFPDQPEAFYTETLTGMWDNLGRVMAELPHLAKIVSDPHRVTLVGAEHAQVLMTHEGVPYPGLFFSAHLGNWELAAPMTSRRLHLPISLIYRIINNPFVERLLLRARRKSGPLLTYHPKGTAGGIACFKALRDGGTVGLLLDQKLDEGLDVPFLGHLAKTASTLAKFAIRYTAPIVPARIIRTQGAHFILEFSPPIYPKADDTPYDITLACNNLMSDWIKEHPSQWFWVHSRWGFSKL